MLAGLAFCMSVALLVIRYKSREYGIQANQTYGEIKAVSDKIDELNLEVASLAAAPL